MLEPRNDGPFERWDSLAETLTPLLANARAFFLPWSRANSDALEAGDESFSVDLPGGAYVQGPQKYHARSLVALRQKYAAAAGAPGLKAILAETAVSNGCNSGARKGGAVRGRSSAHRHRPHRVVAVAAGKGRQGVEIGAHVLHHR